jgi:hypothetical protein
LNDEEGIVELREESKGGFGVHRLRLLLLELPLMLF